MAGGVDAPLTIVPRLSNACWSAVFLGVLQAPPADRPLRDTLRFYAVGDLNLGRTLTYRYLLQATRCIRSPPRRHAARRGRSVRQPREPIAPLDHPFEQTAASSSAALRSPPSPGARRFDIVSNANNHAWDVADRVFETLTQLDRVGLAHAGTGRTVADAHRPRCSSAGAGASPCSP